MILGVKAECMRQLEVRALRALRHFVRFGATDFRHPSQAPHSTPPAGKQQRGQTRCHDSARSQKVQEPPVHPIQAGGPSTKGPDTRDFAARQHDATRLHHAQDSVGTPAQSGRWLSVVLFPPKSDLLPSLFHHCPIRQLSWSPGGTRLALVDQEGQLCVFDILPRPGRPGIPTPHDVGFCFMGTAFPGCHSGLVLLFLHRPDFPRAPG